MGLGAHETAQGLVRTRVQEGYMSYKNAAGLMLVVLLFSGCGGNKTPSVSETEKKVGDTEQQLQQAKAEPGTDQKVADLEKQLADLKKQLAQSKGQPAPGATGGSSPAAAGNPGAPAAA